MKLTELSIRRPLFILMIVVGLVIMGVISYTRLGADQYPTVNIPYVSVLTLYPGADPEEVEGKVTKPLEDALAGASGLKNLSSVSLESLSVVTLEFQEGVSGSDAAIDVERRVAAARSSLPDEAQVPRVVKADYGNLPIISLALTGQRSSEQLYRLAENQVMSRLETVKGVASVRVVGGREREIKVKVAQDRLRAYGLSIQQLQAALGQGNLSLPAGTADAGDVRYRVRYDAQFQSTEELAGLVLQSTPKGVIRLGDVAQVEDGLKEQDFISRFNGVDSVGLLITKQATANTMQVADDLRATVAEVEKTLPPRVQLAVASDSSQFVRRDLDDIQRTLIVAVVLTGLVLLLFLHTLRSTIIVLLSIPTSLISTFMVMALMGFTLNMMSMLALALTIGILVDDSIVVLENIVRHLKLGETPWTAALNGRSEIGLAAIAITLVDVVVYIPVAFMSGVVGQFFRQFGLTIAAATLFSLFISFTLTPMLASRWLRATEGGHSWWTRWGQAWERGYEAVARGYGSTLAWALRHRVTVVFIGLVAFGGALSMVALNVVKTEFLPVEDQARFGLTAEMPPGASLLATDEAVRELEGRLQRLPEIQSYFTTVGMGSSVFVSTGEARFARIAVNLVPKGERSKSATQVARETERLAQGIPGMTLRANLPTSGGDIGQPFEARLRGSDQATLNRIADQAISILKETPGAINITSSSYGGSPEVRVRGDQGKLADLGLTSAAAATALRANFEGVVVGQLQPPGEEKVDIRLLGAEKGTWQPDKVADLPLLTSKGAVVKLAQAAEAEMDTSPTEVDRFNRQRVVTIGADLAGRPLGEVVADFQGRMKAVSLPPGYSLTMAGEADLMNESFVSMGMALALSILLMYMLMVALYESLLHPLVIMFSLPVSLVGAFSGLALSGQTINIASLIGLIMLMGLVAKNAILLVDYTNTLRSRGMERDAAIREAGPTRLRPILMTTIAMVMAMTPVAFQIGHGAETRSPMAIVVVGGLLSSMLLTLVLVPVMYAIMDDIQASVRRLLGRQGQPAPLDSGHA